MIGATAGAPTAEDMKNFAASEPLAVKLADVVGHNRIAINMVWMLFCGFLVMFMQAGFALAETGFTQAKNAGHTMAMNFVVYAVGTPNALPGHHIPMALTGCFILAFGWFGFNAGSSLAGGDLRIAVVAVNTMLASAAAAFSAMAYMWVRYGKPDISMIANGFLAGLVAITAPCAFVNSVSAVIIGAIAGIILCISVFFVERVMKVDDPEFVR